MRAKFEDDPPEGERKILILLEGSNDPLTCFLFSYIPQDKYLNVLGKSFVLNVFIEYNTILYVKGYDVLERLINCLIDRFLPRIANET